MFEEYITEIVETGRLTPKSMSSLLALMSEEPFLLSTEDRSWILEHLEPCALPCRVLNRLLHSITLPEGFPALTPFTCTANCEGYTNLSKFLITYDSI